MTYGVDIPYLSISSCERTCREVPVFPATCSFAPLSLVAVPSEVTAFMALRRVSAVALEQMEAFSTLGPSFFFTVPFFSMLSTRYGFIIFPLLAMAL